jgi:hypothetical protein
MRHLAVRPTIRAFVILHFTIYEVSSSGARQAGYNLAAASA